MSQSNAEPERFEYHPHGLARTPTRPEDALTAQRDGVYRGAGATERARRRRVIVGDGLSPSVRERARRRYVSGKTQSLYGVLRRTLRE